MKRRALLALLVLMIATPASTAAESETKVVIASKKFTESVILGEIARHLVQTSGLEAVHRKELGGTSVLWNALVAGEIDIYPEYTGTIQEELFAERGLGAIAEYGVRMTPPLGFENTYALGMKEDLAKKLDIRTISDLARHPKLRLGFTSEFMNRRDGWPGLKKRYGLSQSNVPGLDHDLAYRGLEKGTIHVTDLYSTDAEIQYYSLRVLEDDRNYFPEYHAVFLYRAKLEKDAPGVVSALYSMAQRINEQDMIAMNVRAKPRNSVDRVSEGQVAADYLERLKKGRSFSVSKVGVIQRIWRHTKEHLLLVSLSLAVATLLSVPLGVVAAKRAWVGQAILGVVGMIQTIPALALLVLLILVLGEIGWLPAIVALILYSLLPIVRNTYTGLVSIPGPLRESGVALGLSASARLWLLELPLASRTILAGIKTSAVINVGFATLGALIGAGGYGQPILTGIRLNDYNLILQGAVPAAILAIAIQGFFELIERALVPKGLRFKPAT